MVRRSPRLRGFSLRRAGRLFERRQPFGHTYALFPRDGIARAGRGKWRNGYVFTDRLARPIAALRVRNIETLTHAREIAGRHVVAACDRRRGLTPDLLVEVLSCN